MAMLLIEGFDEYSTDAEMQRGGWNFSSLAAVNQSAPVHGTLGRAIQVISTNAYASHPFGPSTATFVLGCAEQFIDAGPSNGVLFSLLQGGNNQIDIRTVAGGEIQIRRGTSTVIGLTVGAGLSMGLYFYIEIKMFLHASTGTIDVWVDGINVLSDTGLNTLNTSTAEIDVIRCVGHSTPEPGFDSLYILDDSGSDNTDRLGEVFVETLVPDADGNVNNFTRVGGGSNNFEAVDEIGPADDDTTYNHSATATDQELYGMTALAGGIGTVFAVQASALVRKEDPGERFIRLVARSNVTEVESPNRGFGVAYRYISHIYENDPDGGTDWDEAAVNAAQFGIVLEQ